MFKISKKKPGNKEPNISNDLSGLANEPLAAQGRISARYRAVLADIIKTRFDSVCDVEGEIGPDLEKLARHLQLESKADLEKTVALACNLAEEIIMAANMMRDVRNIDERAQAIAAAAEEMVVTGKEIERASDTASQETEKTAQSAVQGQKAAGKASEAMSSIMQAVQEASRKTEGLSKSSEDIGNIVQKIEDIADQTNLLALNATIEAARAGEAGKGFAVVASEVKTLSQQTAEATVDIRSMISTLQEEMASIVGSMEQGMQIVAQGSEVITENTAKMQEIGTQAATANSHMQEILRILQDQQQASQEVAKGIEDIAEMSSHNLGQIEKLVEAIDVSEKHIVANINKIMEKDIPDKTILVAKSDHMMWRKRLAAMVVGRESLRPSELADHHSCRLGKWYDSLSDQSILNHPAYAALEEPHKKVHQYGIEAARLYENGKIDECLENITKVAAASVDVIRYLDELAQRGNSKRS